MIINCVIGKEPPSSKAPVVSVSIKPYCSVLVGYSHGIESNFTIELNKIRSLQLIYGVVKIVPSLDKVKIYIFNKGLYEIDMSTNLIGR